MKRLKRLSSLFFALVLVLTLPLQVFAETYYLEDGSVVVSTDDTNQYVSQGYGDAHKQTTETIVTQRDSSAPTSYTITVDTSASSAKAAEVTIQDVNISTPGTAIEVGSASVTINLEGNNAVTTTGAQDAAIHVTSGGLTINGGSSDSLTVTASTATTAGGAAIGTDYENGENLTGNITINGGNITANGGYGSAAIGTGMWSNMDDASINITGGNVVANGGHAGAAIGTGHFSTIGDDAEINISGGTVVATGGKYGAGIGTTDTDDLFGKISISGGDVTAIGGDDTPGIGGGELGYGAEITISGGTVTAVGGRDSAGIGAYSDMEGDSKISISGDADVITQAGPGDRGTPYAIGPGYGTVDKDAEITIDGNATVTVTNGGTLPAEASISGNATVTTTDKTYQEVLDARNPVPASQPEPEAEEEKPAPSFWDTILWKLKKAEDGTQFTIEAADCTWIPRSVLTTAREKNITLIIQWNGGDDITVAPTDDIDLAPWCIQLKDLA